MSKGGSNKQNRDRFIAVWQLSGVCVWRGGYWQGEGEGTEQKRKKKREKEITDMGNSVVTARRRGWRWERAMGDKWWLEKVIKIKKNKRHLLFKYYDLCFYCLYVVLTSSSMLAKSNINLKINIGFYKNTLMYILNTIKIICSYKYV